MLLSYLKDYLNSYILHKNGYLYVEDILGQNGVMDVKKTARTRRVVAKLVIGIETSVQKLIPDKQLSNFNVRKAQKILN